MDCRLQGEEKESPKGSTLSAELQLSKCKCPSESP